MMPVGRVEERCHLNQFSARTAAGRMKTNINLAIQLHLRVNNEFATGMSRIHTSEIAIT